MKQIRLWVLSAAIFGASTLQAAPLCRLLVHNSQTSSYSNEITVIIGTDRAGSNSSVVAHEILNTLTQQPDTRVNLVDLAKLPKSIFKSDYFAQKPAAFVNEFSNPIERAQALMFVIPEYDGAIPGILSYFMNHVRVGLDNKMVSLVGISAGKWGARAALDAFKGTLTHRKAQVLGGLQVNIENIEGKVHDGRVSDTDSQNRLVQSTRDLVKNVNKLPSSLSSQKNWAIMARGLRGRAASITLNSGLTLQGRLNQYSTNTNQTLSFLQLRGPVTVEQGQRSLSDIGPSGSSVMGFPVGEIKGFPRGWFQKADFIASHIKAGQNIRLEYESGITVTGHVKKMITDSRGQVLAITLTQPQVIQGSRQLIDSNINEYDLVVADFIENLTAAE